jgi:hypothetical protein
MNDSELGNKLVEREHLDLFVAGEEFTDIVDNETPASEVGLTNSLGCAATSSRISPKRRVLCLKSAL